MDDFELVNYQKAGKIAGEALDFGANLIKPGVLLLEVAEKIEQRILDSGAQIAFPVNISLNTTAAHYTPIPRDESTFTDELVKLDVGVHIQGCIGDTARTIDLSQNNSDLKKASEEALKAAINTVRPGATLGEIGKEVEAAIKSINDDFNPVRNLSGHGISKFRLHTGVSIPNYDTKDTIELTDGQVVAIEPFATNGVGFIAEKGLPYIHSQIAKKPIRSQTARQILKQIEHFNNLPFATRWVTKGVPAFKVAVALRELKAANIIRSYPPLVEKSDGLVSQAEHTVIVKDKPIVTTKI